MTVLEMSNEEAIKYIRTWKPIHPLKQEAITKAIRALMAQPKKGNWQPYKYGDDTWHQCSVCGVADRYINIVKRDGYPDNRMVCKRNFCPNCGADMRESIKKEGEQE